MHAFEVPDCKPYLAIKLITMLRSPLPLCVGFCVMFIQQVPFARLYCMLCNDCGAHAGRWRGTLVAIKVVEQPPFPGCNSSLDEQQIEHGALLASMLRHPHIISTYKICVAEAGHAQELRSSPQGYSLQSASEECRVHAAERAGSAGCEGAIEGNSNIDSTSPPQLPADPETSPADSMAPDEGLHSLYEADMSQEARCSPYNLVVWLRPASRQGVAGGGHSLWFC